MGDQVVTAIASARKSALQTPLDAHVAVINSLLDRLQEMSDASRLHYIVDALAFSASSAKSHPKEKAMALLTRDVSEMVERNPGKIFASFTEKERDLFADPAAVSHFLAELAPALLHRVAVDGLVTGEEKEEFGQFLSREIVEESGMRRLQELHDAFLQDAGDQLQQQRLFSRQEETPDFDEEHPPERRDMRKDKTLEERAPNWPDVVANYRDNRGVPSRREKPVKRSENMVWEDYLAQRQSTQNVER